MGVLVGTMSLIDAEVPLMSLLHHTMAAEIRRLGHQLSTQRSLVRRSNARSPLPERRARCSPSCIRFGPTPTTSCFIGTMPSLDGVGSRHPPGSAGSVAGAHAPAQTAYSFLDVSRDPKDSGEEKFFDLRILDPF